MGHATEAGGLVTFQPSVLEDRGAWLLIKQLLNGSLVELQPVLDSLTPYGFRYPEAERTLETDAKGTVVKLEQLHRAGLLEGELLETIFTCQQCESPDLHPQYQCLKCSGGRLVQYLMVEHFSCGHVAPRSEFESKGKKLVCPSCSESLEGEQQDYKVEVGFNCLDCKTISAQPRLMFRCFQCKTISSASEMKGRALYVYRLNMSHRGDIIHYLGYHPTPEAEKPSRQKHRVDLDDMDRRILNLLQQDARLSFRNVSRRLKVSDATIRSRVARLEQNNTIKGFSTMIDPQQVGMDVFGLIQLEVEANQLANFTEAIRTIEEVKLVMETGERQNLILLVSFPTRDTLNTFLDQQIRGKPGIQLHTVTIALGLRKYDWTMRL
ncbi:MAG: AsnC family transcriptional regulator [Promethearchaeota archaeon]